MKKTQTCILFLLSLFISSCATAPIKVVSIPLAEPVSENLPINKKKNLLINVSKQFFGESAMGGDDSFTKVHFQQVVPWLRHRLSVLNNSDCNFRKKITLNISVRKLYMGLDSGVSVGTLVLDAHYIKKGITLSTKQYRGECESNFFTLTQNTAIQTCFNSAMNQIIHQMKRDICHFN
jgi:hypothetical protein